MTEIHIVRISTCPPSQNPLHLTHQAFVQLGHAHDGSEAIYCPQFNESALGGDEINRSAAHLGNNDFMKHSLTHLPRDYISTLGSTMCMPALMCFHMSTRLHSKSAIAVRPISPTSNETSAKCQNASKMPESTIDTFPPLYIGLLGSLHMGAPLSSRGTARLIDRSTIHSAYKTTKSSSLPHKMQAFHAQPASMRHARKVTWLCIRNPPCAYTCSSTSHPHETRALVVLPA